MDCRDNNEKQSNKRVSVHPLIFNINIKCIKYTNKGVFMEKTMLKIISAILIFVFYTIAFSSCSFIKDDIDNLLDDNDFDNLYDDDFVCEDWNFYPEGYTCGFGLQPGSTLEYWWIETYDECINAIKLLESHGSTFSDHITFSYEGGLFDTKYCFILGGKKDEISFGDNPFDRYAEGVIIQTYAFFEEVSIDEINYSYISNYEAYIYGIGTVYMNGYENITIDDLVIGDWVRQYRKYSKKAYYNDSIAFFVKTCFYVKDISSIENSKMTNEVLTEIIKSGTMIKIGNV